MAPIKSISALLSLSFFLSEAGCLSLKSHSNNHHRRSLLRLNRREAAAALSSAPLLLLAPSAATAKNNNKSRSEGYSVQKSDTDWQSILSPTQYNILREGGTERPNSSVLEAEERTGDYKCAGCGSKLFESSEKFHSGTGWPSFAKGYMTNVEIEQVGVVQERLLGAELRCATCGGHLGDVFNDGYLFVGTPAFVTGKRLCIDGAALVFVPANSGEGTVRGDTPKKKEVPSWLEPPSITPATKV